MILVSGRNNQQKVNHIAINKHVSNRKQAMSMLAINRTILCSIFTE